MDFRRPTLVLILAFSFSEYSMATPDPTVDPDAEVVHLRKNCDVAGSPKENCFEKMSKLRNWLFGSTIPARSDPSARILIDIGPGDFTPLFACSSTTASFNFSFRGAGVGKTNMAVWSVDCPNGTWAFQDMTMLGTIGVAGSSVAWFGGGETTWNNVHFKGDVRAWYDLDIGGTEPPCELSNRGTHRFFASRFTTESDSSPHAFRNSCGDIWFWGSEIHYTSGPGMSGGTAIRSDGATNQIHLYGSNVRSELHPDANPTGDLTAITVFDGAQLHSHGVGIDVVGKAGWTLTALDVSSGAHVHANESSFVLEPSSATLRRISNNGGHVSAPFNWAPATTAPAISSVDGADTAVITGGAHPVMVIYDSACASSWYDIVDKVCMP